MGIHYAPRAGYGLTAPVLIAEDGGIRSRGGPASYVLSTQTQLHIRHRDASARVRVIAGQVLNFAMEVSSPWEEPAAYRSGAEIEAMLESTICGWRSWSTLHQSYRGPYAETVPGWRIAAGEDLHILYGVGGERLVPEHHLDHLDGYLHRRPVRVGNGAWNQPQLDVYGELLDAAWTYDGEIDRFEPVTAQFLIDVADTAATRWTEPDHGIWEVRGRPRHFVHSKLMCWVALDRAIRLADKLEAHDRVDHWRAVRDQIRTALETNGWNEAVGAYSQSFGSDELDASSLMLLLSGFLPAEDRRMVATV